VYHGWKRALRVVGYPVVSNVLYEDWKAGAEIQFKSQYLDQVHVDYIDKHEIINPVPIVWWDSLILYSYLMLIHNRMHAAALKPTFKDIHKTMRVPKELFCDQI